MITAKIFFVLVLTMTQCLSKSDSKTVPVEISANIHGMDVHSLALPQLDGSVPQYYFDLVTDDRNTTVGSSWLSGCQELSKDFENSWNLTERVAIKGWGHLYDLGEVLYDLINCQGTFLVPVPLNCIMHNLGRIKGIIDPTVVEVIGFIKEGIHILPDLVKDTKKCLTFS